MTSLMSRWLKGVSQVNNINIYYKSLGGIFIHVRRCEENGASPLEEILCGSASGSLQYHKLSVFVLYSICMQH